MRWAGSTLVGPALAFCIAAVASGCSGAPGYPPSAIARPQDQMDFATLYGQNCAACHGRNGQNGPAIDLANPEYQALIDDGTMRKWISNGMPGTQMPAFAQSAGGMLTDAQINSIIMGMRSHWRAQNAFAGATPPAYAQNQAGDAQRGQQTYQARCAGCHQSSRQQITGRDYLALVGNQALRSIILAGRPDIGQPDWQHDAPQGKTAAPLSAQEVDDIITYMGTLRNPQPVRSGPSATTPQEGRGHK
jgi:cytochrome c oxidase cbb3-type subunit III